MLFDPAADYSKFAFAVQLVIRDQKKKNQTQKYKSKL